MEKKELLYEGKAKKVYTTENPDVLIVDYKDDATAFNGVPLNNPEVAEYIRQFLNENSHGSVLLAGRCHYQGISVYG